MLSSLRIHNLGVIADSTIEPATGMTAVTGETGAGKTMVVTGLGMLLGQKVDAGLIRHGADKCRVEGTFTAVSGLADELEELGAETDGDELIVARQITGSGRSRAFLGGAQVPLAKQAELTGELATVHGQSEQLRLGTPARQREVLDRAGGPAHLAKLASYRELWEQRQQAQRELADLTRSATERAREYDMLMFGLDEIAAVDPQPGEDDELAAEAGKLQAVDDLRMLASEASQALSGSDEGDLDQPGAIGLVGIARKAIGRIADLDESARDVATAIREASSAVNEVAAQTAGYLADLDADPARLETITSRRAELAALTRKYGPTVDDVLEWSKQSAQRVTTLSGSDERISALTAELAKLNEQILKLGHQLTEGRERAAAKLAKAVMAELAALAMPHARLHFDLEPLPEPGPWGLESVALMFAANPGSEPAPLAKVASGGELSRVRLALEVVLAADDPGHVFVFDEVDAGVGGAVGVEIGKRLAMLAKHSQVIIVTHLAQVAAFADAHFVVSKSSDGEVTTSDVRQLTEAERETELARMMGGLKDSTTGTAHARELMDTARAAKA